MRVFKEFWADMGDYISIQYAGTESTTTNVTLNGKKGIKGGFQHMNVTINRFFIGTFQDEFKQKAIELFLQQQKVGHIKSRLNNYIITSLHYIITEFFLYL